MRRLLADSRKRPVRTGRPGEPGRPGRHLVRCRQVGVAAGLACLILAGCEPVAGGGPAPSTSGTPVTTGSPGPTPTNTAPPTQSSPSAPASSETTPSPGPTADPTETTPTSSPGTTDIRITPKLTVSFMYHASYINTHITIANPDNPIQGPMPTGTVTIYQEAAAIATVPLEHDPFSEFQDAVARWNKDVVTGNHEFRASYSGDEHYHPGATEFTHEGPASALQVTVPEKVITGQTLVVDIALDKGVQTAPATGTFEVRWGFETRTAPASADGKAQVTFPVFAASPPGSAWWVDVKYIDDPVYQPTQAQKPILIYPAD